MTTRALDFDHIRSERLFHPPPPFLLPLFLLLPLGSWFGTKNSPYGIPNNRKIWDMVQFFSVEMGG